MRMSLKLIRLFISAGLLLVVVLTVLAVYRFQSYEWSFLIIPIGVIICFIFLGIAIFSFKIPLSKFEKRIERDQEIMKNGIDGKAEVVSISNTGGYEGRGYLARLELNVKTFNGPHYAIVVASINALYAPQFQPGKVLDVKYLKEDPSQVVINQPTQ